MLRRYGSAIHLDERKVKVGLYLFRRHGGKVVFFGRFVAILRAWAAFLAGTNRMPWSRFLLFSALGGIVWATVYGLGGYFPGATIHRLAGPLGTITLVLAVSWGWFSCGGTNNTWKSKQSTPYQARLTTIRPLSASLPASLFRSPGDAGEPIIP